MNFFKACYYLLSQDKEKKIFYFFFKNPLFLIFGLLRSLFFHKKVIEKAINCYGIQDLRTFFSKLRNQETSLVLALSYCHKKCSNIFSKTCQNSPFCKECFFYQSRKLLLPQDHFIIIKTVNELANFWIDEIHLNQKKALFLISACPFSQKIFERFATFLKISALGLPLRGEICNNFKLFSLAERGKKRERTLLSKQHKLFVIRELTKRKALFEKN